MDSSWVHLLVCVMKTIIRTFISIILIFTAVIETDAQSVSSDGMLADSIVAPESKPGLGKRLNNKLTDIYFKQKYDTTYVVRPKQKWLLRVLGNYAGDHIHAKGTVNNVWSKYDLHTRRNTTIGLEVNYCDLVVTLAINPDKLRGVYNDYELNLEYHSSMFSIDFSYQHSTSLAGKIKLGNIDHLNEDGLNMRVVNFAGYYTFNHRRFSFPAALYQNYYQRRSAGSWLAGISFQGGSIKTTDELKARSPQAPEVQINFNNFALGGGYGYNFVFGKRSQWLLHLSALPSVVVYRHNTLTLNQNEKRDHGLSLNMIFNERAAVVYHFSPRYFIGTSLIISNSIFDNEKITVNQNKWFSRIFFGFRL